MTNLWFPIHLHYVPEKLVETLNGAVICVEWRQEQLKKYYNYTGEWSNEPGKRILQFLEKWPELAKETFPDDVHFTVEDEADFGDDLDIITELRKKGLKSIQIYHDYDTKYFSKGNGISSEGRELFRRMQDNDVILDLSHLQGKSLTTILNGFSGRKIVSHAPCSELLSPSQSRRANALTDEELRNCNAELYGVPFLDDLVSRDSHYISADREAKVEDIRDHTLRMCSVVGVDRVALGPDFFDYKSSFLNGVEVNPVKTMDTFEGIKRLYDLLIESGLSTSDIENVFYKNAQRVFQN